GQTAALRRRLAAGARRPAWGALLRQHRGGAAARVPGGRPGERRGAAAGGRDGRRGDRPAGGGGSAGPRRGPLGGRQRRPWVAGRGAGGGRVELSEHGAFSGADLRVRVALKGARWVRLEAWDVAANGAFSQPVWVE